jgi:hypothetical protein
MFNEEFRSMFAPGVLEEFQRTMSDEEIIEMVNKISSSINNGAALNHAVKLDSDLLKQSNPIAHDALQQYMNSH